MTPGAVAESETPVFSDDFDADAVGSMPPGWLYATTDAPTNSGTQVDDTIEPVFLSPGAASPPNAVRVGPLDFADGARYDYDLSIVVDASTALGPGDFVRIRFATWLMELEGGDRFALLVRDRFGVSVEAWAIDGPHESVAQDLYAWQPHVVDVAAGSLDFAGPITLTFRATLDAAEGGFVVSYDGAYVDSVAVSAVHRAVTCSPCSASPLDTLYRLDVSAPPPLDPALFLVPPRGDGIALNVAPYAPMSGPGPDPLDPSALTNGVPLSFYQVAHADGSPTTLTLRKSGGTVWIDY